MGKVNRREILRVLGLGVASLGPAAAVLALRPSDPVARRQLRGAQGDSPNQDDAHPPWHLLAPLTEGSIVLGARLVEVTGVTKTGTVDIDFVKAGDTSFRIRLCRRDSDPDAPTPVAQTDKYDLFLANHGKGDLPTDEQEGKTAMMIASVVKKNEASVEELPVVTIRQRWQRLAQGSRQG